ncbi:Intradiol ring-cleavage dioxygenase [Aspergillus venezuelensis]
MHFSIIGATLAFSSIALAHPEKLTAASAKHHHATRSTSSCVAKIEARREEISLRRRESLLSRRSENSAMLAERNVYPTIQNTTCVLAPETIWGPYGIDGELHRHDVRENQKGIDLYLDIGVIDVETCEPLPDAYLTIWACNATGTYSSYTGIDPDTAELLDGWTKNDQGTTDNETFLRGITKTDSEGMSEFLTIFPGYYTSRTTHIHVTVQTNVTDDETSYSTAAVQHIGQLFFEEDLLNTVYQEEPYVQHLATLNRTTNAEDSLLSSIGGGYSPIISTALLGETIAEGLVGYITIGVNRSAEAREVTGTDVNPQGFIPTVTPSAGAQEAAYALDHAEGYVDK